MAGSMHVPLSRLPVSIEEVCVLVNAACLKYAYAPPALSLHNGTERGDALAEGFIMIEGDSVGEQCWVSLGSFSAEITEDPERTFMASVNTRHDWLFAGVIAYAFCSFSGQDVLNDAGCLDGQERYSRQSLDGTLKKMIAQTRLA